MASLDSPPQMVCTTCNGLGETSRLSICPFCQGKGWLSDADIARHPFAERRSKRKQIEHIEASLPGLSLAQLQKLNKALDALLEGN